MATYKRPTIVDGKKGSFYDSFERNWDTGFKNEHGKHFDNLIFYCVSRDGKYIERIYIFPKIEIVSINGINIPKDYPRGWYKKYRINDEEILKKVNEIWKDILIRKKVNFC